ncbi:winged helix-turn-helix domain-containing protein [Paraherbaspirillum soli]|uniref:Winged helix-turn-helix domain-containing protein n=1 Tax=Paraherbaspirillum soli TaxID=631222 RepID=A0ABW0MDG2_9BURK
MKALDIVLYCKTETLADRIQRELPSDGFAVFGCTNTHALYRGLRRKPASLLVLVGDVADICAVLGPLPSADIIGILAVLAGDASEDDRISVLQAGADVCICDGGLTREFANAVLAMDRHLERWKTRVVEGWRDMLYMAPTLTEQAEHSLDYRVAAHVGSRSRKTQAWHLINGGTTLVSPNGTQLTLRPKERCLLSALLARPNQEIHSSELYAIVWSGTGRGADGTPNKRALAVEISRLRQRARLLGLELPVRPIHGKGYIFAGDALSC